MGLFFLPLHSVYMRVYKEETNNRMKQAIIALLALLPLWGTCAGHRGGRPAQVEPRAHGHLQPVRGQHRRQPGGGGCHHRPAAGTRPALGLHPARRGAAGARAAARQLRRHRGCSSKCWRTRFVVQTVAGCPAEKVGILPGDRMIYIEDTLIAGVKMKSADIMRRLRGRAARK